MESIFSGIGNTIWMGCVEDRNDPLRMGRVRVRVMGIHTDNKSLLPTEDLPWAMVMQPTTSAAISGIGSSPLGMVEGTWVVGFFMDGGDAQQPLVIGTIGSYHSRSAEISAQGLPNQDTPANVSQDTDGYVPPANIGNGKQSLAIAYFQQLGWTMNQSVGIVANLIKESTPKLDHTAVGDSGKAYGLAQWHAPRQLDFESYFKKPIRQSSFEEQLKFINIELTVGAHKSAGNKLKKTKTAEEAAHIICEFYEIPANMASEKQQRGAIANSIVSMAGKTYNNLPAPASKLATTTEKTNTGEDVSLYGQKMTNVGTVTPAGFVVGQTNVKVDPGFISDYKKDKNSPNGACYGTYSLASYLPRMMGSGKARQAATTSPLAGYMKFSKFSQWFGNSQPATPEFDKKWKELAAKYPDAFQEDQRQYVKSTTFDPYVSNLRSHGIDIMNYGVATQSYAWDISNTLGTSGMALAPFVNGVPVRSALSEEDMLTFASKYMDKNIEAMTQTLPDVVKKQANSRLAKRTVDLLRVSKYSSDLAKIESVTRFAQKLLIANGQGINVGVGGVASIGGYNIGVDLDIGKMMNAAGINIPAMLGGLGMGEFMDLLQNFSVENAIDVIMGSDLVQGVQDYIQNNIIDVAKEMGEVALETVKDMLNLDAIMETVTAFLGDLFGGIVGGLGGLGGMLDGVMSSMASMGITITGLPSFSALLIGAADEMAAKLSSIVQDKVRDLFTFDNPIAQLLNQATDHWLDNLTDDVLNRVFEARDKIVMSSKGEKLDYTNPVLYDASAENGAVLAKTSSGFSDPTGVFPKPEYQNRPDTNKLAVGEINGTVVTQKNRNRRMGAALPNGASFEEPMSAYNAQYPYNKVVQTESGHVIELDDTPNAERIHVYHKSGSYIEIDAVGNIVKKTVGTDYQIIERNGNLSVAGNYNISVAGNANIMVANDCTLETVGNFTVKSGNDINLYAEGKVNIGAGASAEVHSRKIYLDSELEMHLTSLGKINQMSQAASITAQKAYAISGGAVGIKASGSALSKVAIESTGLIGIKSAVSTSIDSMTIGISGTATTLINSKGVVGIDGTALYMQSKMASVTIPAGGAPDAESAKFSSVGLPTGIIKPYAYIDLPDIKPFTKEDAWAIVNESEEGEFTEGMASRSHDVLSSTRGTVADSQEYDRLTKIGCVEMAKDDTAHKQIKTSPDTGYECLVGLSSYPLSLKLSPNFNLGMVSSKTALANPNNTVSGQVGLTAEEIVLNLRYLCVNVLEPIKRIYPDMIVTSAFRKGTGKSQHHRGEAVDLQFANMSKTRYYEISKALKNLIPFDQLLLEYKTTGTGMPWIHVSLRRPSVGNNRYQLLTLMNGATASQGLVQLA